MKRLLVLNVVLGTLLTLPLAAQVCTDNVTWTGAVNTDWNTAGNWNPARVPTQSDTVTIPTGKTVTNQPGAGLGTGFICSLTLDGTLTVDTSALILLSTTVASTVNNLTLTAAQGVSGLTIHGSATFNGSLVLNPGQVDGPGMATINGAVKVSKGPSFLVTATINNEGSVAITQDGVQLTLGTSVFNNDGPIDLQGDGIAVLGGGTFENSRFGSITKSKGPGASSFSPAAQFSTAGSVAAQTGTLVFSAVGTSTGIFNANGTLQFTNHLTMNAGTTIGGTGTADIVAGGVWDLKAPLTVNTQQLTLDGAAGNVILGDSDITINSQVTWNGGWLGTSGGSAKATFTKNVTIATAASHASFRTLDILASVTMNADLSMNAPNSTAPTVIIEPGATFNIGTDNGIHGQCTINNNGTFAKTGGTQISRLDYSGNFNTLTTVAVNSGTLNFVIIGGGTLAADLTANTGATLEFSNGSYTVSPGTVFSGSGTTLLTGQATWTASGTTSVNSSVFEFDSGQINGTGTLTINSPNFTWTGGSMQGAGITNLAGGTTTIKEGGVRVIGRTINNFHRTVLLDDAAKLFLADATWNNEPGSFLVFQTDGNIADGAAGPSVFNNSGIVHKEGGFTSAIAFNGTFNNNAGAQVSTTAHLLFLQSSQGASAGAFIAQGGVHNTLAFGGFNGRGIWSINSGTTMSGAGSIAISNATWNLTIPLQVQSRAFSSANPSIITGTFDLTLGSRYIGLNGMRTGGTVKIPNSTSEASVGDLSLDACRLDNSGEVTINPHSNGGGMVLTNSSALLNEASGMVTLARRSVADNPVIQISGDSAVSNLGTITLNTDDLSNLVQQIRGVGGNAVGQFDNSNLVEVPAGRTLIISVGKGTSKGTYTADGTLTLQDGVFTLASGTVLNGSGTFNLGGTFQVSSNTTLSTSIFQFGPQYSSNGVVGGFIQGTGGLMVAGSQANCDAGTIAMSFPGLVSFSAQTVVTNSSTGSCTTLGARLFNAGTINLNTGSFSLGGGATLNNLPGGTINLQGTTGIHDGGGPGNVLNNQGTVLEGGSANTIDFTGSFNNSGNLTTQGSLNFGLATNYIQTKGSTTVDGGTLSSDAKLEIDGGTVGGSGAIKAKMNIPGGTLGAGSQTTPGTLILSQPETQGPNSTLYELIAETLSPQVYDQINSSSSMTAAGTLKFQFGPGFTPSPTNTFNILTFASGSGTFSRVITPNSTCKAVLIPTTKALNVKFTSTHVTVTINPPSVTLHENEQQQFTDTVSNGCGNGVTWSVKENGGGTIDQTGLYTAPARTGTFHVVVVSVSDPTKFAFSTVTVIAPRNQLAVIPPAATLQPGKTLNLRANQAVAWSVLEGKSGGRMSTNGRYTAPLKPGLYHVVASSAAGPSQRAMANIAVVDGVLKSAYVANIDKDSISVLSPGSDAASTSPLHETTSVATGQKPTALALSPNGKLLVSVNADSNDVSVFALSPASGTLNAVVGAASAAGSQPSAVAFDPSGHFAFVTNRGSDDVSIFSADVSGQLSLLGGHALAAGEAPGAITVHPQGSLLFVAGTGSNLIHGFTHTASLKEIAGSPFDAGTAPTALAIDAAGQFLFAANRDSGDVSVFGIDATNQTLRQIEGSPFQTGKAPVALAVDLTGSYLFVADHDSNDIVSFHIDGETGALTSLGRTPLPTAGPSALAVDPSGQSLFVTSDLNTSLTALRLNVTNGALTIADKIPGQGKASSIVLATERP